MTTVNLNKPESTFDAIRKSHKDLVPTDIALLATALVESGRFANAIHDGKEFQWNPEQFQSLTESLAREVTQIQNEFEGEKTTKKSSKADEEVALNLILKPNVQAGENILGDREDLKTVFGDMVNEGLEVMYAPMDIGWQWTVSRINWGSATKVEQRRRIKFNIEFAEPHSAVEVGTTTRKRKK